MLKLGIAKNNRFARYKCWIWNWIRWFIRFCRRWISL